MSARENFVERVRRERQVLVRKAVGTGRGVAIQAAISHREFEFDIHVTGGTWRSLSSPFALHNT